MCSCKEVCVCVCVCVQEAGRHACVRGRLMAADRRGTLTGCPTMSNFTYSSTLQDDNVLFSLHSKHPRLLLVVSHVYA